MDYIIPDISTLKRLRPLSQFTDEQLNTLANQLELKTARKKERLIELGCAEDYSLFVIEGEVTLKARDGKVQRLSFDKTQELNPIAQLRPCMYDVIAASPLSYLKIDKRLLTQFAQLMEQGEGVDDISVHMFEGDADANSLTMHLYQDLIEDTIIIPSLPEVAYKIQQVFNSNDANADKVAQVLLTDPVMTGKLIRIANSALYRGVAQIDTLQAAVVRLGMDTIYKLVMTYAMNELFESRSGYVSKRMHQLSTHSRKVAAIAHVLAEKSKKFDPETAMLAGLVHDLGVIVILNYIDLHNEDLSDTQRLEQTIATMRPQITGMLMQKWNFTEEIIHVAEECEDWFRNPGDEADLCDLVMIAQYHSMMGTPEMTLLPPISALPAMGKLHMGPSESIELIKLSRKRIAEIEKLLQ
jgi:HD-like signal output (HDOD) protein